MKDTIGINQGLLDGVKEGLFIVKCNHCKKELVHKDLLYSLTAKGRKQAQRLIKKLGKEPIK